MNGKRVPVRGSVLFWSCAKRSRERRRHVTDVFDICCPLPGDNDVIKLADRLSSNERKIAPRSLRGRSAATCMLISRVGGEATSLCQSVGRYPLHPIGSHLGLRRRRRWGLGVRRLRNRDPDETHHDPQRRPETTQALTSEGRHPCGLHRMDTSTCSAHSENPGAWRRQGSPASCV